MKAKVKFAAALVAFAMFTLRPPVALAFEGRIAATLAQDGQATPLLYTVSGAFLRVELTATNRPNPVDILNRDSGELTLVYPHNRSFVRLKPASESASPIPGTPATPPLPTPPDGLPPGIGPQPAGVGNRALPSAPDPGAFPLPRMPMAGAMPARPMMPMPGESLELRSTGEKTNLLGLTCEKFTIQQRGESMEIWATGQVAPFQPYLENQAHRFGPRRLEEQWGGLLKAKQLFPLLAVLRFDHPAPPGGSALPVDGPERFRFEVKSITPESITDETLFRPPPDYHELAPLPF